VKRNSSYTIGRKINGCSYYREEYGRPLKKLKLPYDPAIPLMGMYPEKSITHKDTCTPMFIAVLFTIARIFF